MVLPIGSWAIRLARVHNQVHDRAASATVSSRTVTDADLVIEAVPELLKIKQETYEKLGRIAPARTIFATNSSTLLPSAMKDFTGRPDRFLALHFANSIWKFNTAEVMGTADTDPAVFDAVVTFAGAIGMVPIPIRKEKAGYVLNSLLGPFLNAAADLAAGGYATPRTWTRCGGSRPEHRWGRSRSTT